MPLIRLDFTMTMLIRVADVCDALEAVLTRLSPATGDAVQFLLDVIPDQSRSLCFVPVRAGGVTEVCAYHLYVSEREEAAAKIVGANRRSEPAGWVALLGADAPTWQARWLVQSIEAFHFFAPLNEMELDELADVDEQLAGTVKALQRIRPVSTEELFDEAMEVIPPVAFTAPLQGVIRMEEALSDRLQCCPRCRANAALLPQSMLVLLHAPGTTIEVDPNLGPVHRR